MRLLGDRLLIQLDPDPVETVSGLLYKPDGACEHVYHTGEVIATGPGKWFKNYNVRIPNDVEVGDGVLFIKFVATYTKTAQSIQHVVGKDRAIITVGDVLIKYDRSEPLPKLGQ